MKPIVEQTALIFQNAAGEGPGILGDILPERGWSIRLVRLHREEPIPADWRDHGMLVIMGGPMNVYEEDQYPYLAPETSVIREALKANMPTLGFCLGAQLMAKAAGAAVKRGPRREIGWYRVRLTAGGAEDPLMKRFPSEFTVFQWHGDTFDIPPGAVRIAGSKRYVNQAMRVAALSYGFQFHFEITREMIARWLEAYGDEVAEMGAAGLPGTVLRQAETYLPRAHALARRFLEGYLKKLSEWR